MDDNEIIEMFLLNQITESGIAVIEITEKRHDPLFIAKPKAVRKTFFELKRILCRLRWQIMMNANAYRLTPSDKTAVRNFIGMLRDKRKEILDAGK